MENVLEKYFSLYVYINRPNVLLNIGPSGKTWSLLGSNTNISIGLFQKYFRAVICIGAYLTAQNEREWGNRSKHLFFYGQLNMYEMHCSIFLFEICCYFGKRWRCTVLLYFHLNKSKLFEVASNNHNRESFVHSHGPLYY